MFGFGGLVIVYNWLSLMPNYGYKLDVFLEKVKLF